MCRRSNFCGTFSWCKLHEIKRSFFFLRLIIFFPSVFDLSFLQGSKLCRIYCSHEPAPSEINVTHFCAIDFKGFMVIWKFTFQMAFILVNKLVDSRNKFVHQLGTVFPNALVVMSKFKKRKIEARRIEFIISQNVQKFPVNLYSSVRESRHYCISVSTQLLRCEKLVNVVEFHSFSIFDPTDWY